MFAGTLSTQQTTVKVRYHKDGEIDCSGNSLVMEIIIEQHVHRELRCSG